MTVDRKIYDRVLTTQCWVWVNGFETLPQGIEMRIPSLIGETVANGFGHLDLATGDEGVSRRCPLIMAACGSRMNFHPLMIQVPECAAPIVQVSGLVTNARIEKVEGWLIRPRSDKDARKWLFLAGVEPYAFCAASGLILDPLVEEAGFVSAPTAVARDRRKEILGFGDGR